MDGQTGYAKTRDGAHLAYSVTGNGPDRPALPSGYTISIDSLDEEPHVAHVVRRLSSFARLIRFDARGIGLVGSDRPRESADAVDQCADDPRGARRRRVRAGRDRRRHGSAAVRSSWRRRDPERVRALVLVNSAARYIAATTIPTGIRARSSSQFLAENIDPDEEWTFDDSDDVDLLVATLKDDRRFRDWWVRASRRGASPATARALVGCNTRADVRASPARIIGADTRLARGATTLFVPVALGRYLADAHSGSDVRRARRPATIRCLGSTPTCTSTRSRSSSRASVGARRRARARDGAVHRHRGLDRSGSRARRSRVARSCSTPTTRSCAPSSNRFGGREVNTTGDGFVGDVREPDPSRARRRGQSSRRRPQAA